MEKILERKFCMSKAVVLKPKRSQTNNYFLVSLKNALFSIFYLLCTTAQSAQKVY